MSKIFISYRRDDSAAYAHAIYGQLVQHFSKDQVFMDVDTVEFGVDFVGAIEETVGQCDVLVALIGKRWANVKKGAKSRLDDPNDFVRLEISTALERTRRVIPVLVDGMRMPSEKTLPNSLRPLSRRNAIEISNTRFNFDVEQLVTSVRKIVDAIEVSGVLTITEPKSGQTVSGREFLVKGISIRVHLAEHSEFSSRILRKRKSGRKNKWSFIPKHIRGKPRQLY
jgi:hypothetical protein